MLATVAGLPLAAPHACSAGRDGAPPLVALPQVLHGLQVAHGEDLHAPPAIGRRLLHALRGPGPAPVPGVGVPRGGAPRLDSRRRSGATPSLPPAHEATATALEVCHAVLAKPYAGGAMHATTPSSHGAHGAHGHRDHFPAAAATSKSKRASGKARKAAPPPHPLVRNVGSKHVKRRAPSPSVEAYMGAQRGWNRVLSVVRASGVWRAVPAAHGAAPPPGHAATAGHAAGCEAAAHGGRGSSTSRQAHRHVVPVAGYTRRVFDTAVALFHARLFDEAVAVAAEFFGCLLAAVVDAATCHGQSMLKTKASQSE